MTDPSRRLRRRELTTPERQDVETRTSVSSAPRSLRSLAAFCSALLPPECGGPDPVALAGLVQRHLEHAPRPAALAVRAGVFGVDALSRATTGRRLADLPADRRAAVLARLAADPRGALALDGLKSLVVLAYGADSAAPELLARSRSLPVARADADLAVTPSPWWPGVTTAGAVVIGSGAGGAMVARTLARSGVEVVVIEEGRRWRVDEFRSRHPHERYAELYRDGGTTIAIGSPPVVLPVGRGVGGTTLVNSGTCYRPPVPVQRRWRDEHGLTLADPDTFGRYLDEVEATLRVAPAPLEVMGRNGRLALAGAEALGWNAAPIPRNAPDCAGSCQCAIGCPRNAKFGVHLSVLPDACAHGARILSEARVRRILHENGRAVGVQAKRPDGSTIEIRTPMVIVAAGATETPGLLRRSGLGGHPAVGRNLTLHPALGTAGRFEEPVVAWEGILQSAAVDEFQETDGILVEATATPPGMGSMVLPGFGAELLREIGDVAHVGNLGAMIADQPVGRVQNIGNQTIIRYNIAPGDARTLLKAMVIMGRTLFAAGAVEVLTGVTGVGPVRSAEALEATVSTISPGRLHLAAFHPAGSVRAGADPERAAVDAQGRLRGVNGVWVADASVLPSCPEVNPQVSIMAVALAIADGVVGT